jgi:(R,R)-butanediol dehydrogenase / meso-butanediol dehydrogenase / diacetyl reductase
VTDTAERPTRMRAARFYGDHDVRIEDVEVPAPRSGEVLLRVLRSGICGTDATEWKAGPKMFPVATAHPVTGHLGPMVPGHEFVGEIVDAGDTTGFAVGAIVASGAGVSCGECDRCTEGRTNLCARYWTLGLSTDGGLAEYVAAPVSTLVAVPDGLDLDIAALAQPLAVGLHAARRSGVVDGDRVVIIGAGAIGTFTLAGLDALVDADITVVDLPGPKLDRALRLGAHTAVEADRIGDIPPGADVVIEASGAPGQLDRAIALVRDGGRILQVGLPATRQETDIHRLVLREIDVTTTLAHVCGEDLAPALDILATTGLGAELLDSVHPLDDLPAELDRLARGQVDGKVVFDPTVG